MVRHGSRSALRHSRKRAFGRRSPSLSRSARGSRSTVSQSTTTAEEVAGVGENFATQSNIAFTKVSPINGVVVGFLLSAKQGTQLYPRRSGCEARPPRCRPRHGTACPDRWLAAPPTSQRPSSSLSSLLPQSHPSFDQQVYPSNCHGLQGLTLA